MRVFLIIFFTIFSGCGYQAINKANDSNYIISSYKFFGDTQVNKILKRNFDRFKQNDATNAAGGGHPIQFWSDAAKTGTQYTSTSVGTIGNAARQFYGNYFLRAKGATQYAKTVLSPVTQIRNFTTATLFATMQGNIGKGANLLELISIPFAVLALIISNN